MIIWFLGLVVYFGVSFEVGWIIIYWRSGVGIIFVVVGWCFGRVRFLLLKLVVRSN